MNGTQIEVARGKGKYKAIDTGDQSVTEAWNEITLSEGERARLLDESGAVVERVTYHDLDLASESDADTANDETETSAPVESGNDETENAPEFASVPIPDTFNQALAESCIVSLSGHKSRADQWEAAIDAVNYPVAVTPAFFVQNDEYIRAEGPTNTGRDSEINLVVVDRLREGTFSAISARTGRYRVIRAADSYADLRAHMDAKKGVKGYKLREVYVSGDGGRQALTIDAGNECVIGGEPVTLLVTFRTSYDGSTEHELTLEAWHKKGKFRLPVPAVTRKLSARHTTNADDRVIDFAPKLASMIEEWGETIVPMLHVFADDQMDVKLAESELDRVASEAGIGKRHRARLVAEYDIPVSRYGVYARVAEFAETEAKSREAADRWRESIGKAMAKDAKKLAS